MYPLITVIRTDYIMIFSNSANATPIFYVHFELLKNFLFISCQLKSWINRLRNEYEKSLVWIE